MFSFGRSGRVYGRVQGGMGERVQDRSHRARRYAYISPLFSSVLTHAVVVNMAKEKQWEDVKLLSFDLQTVEFTYASVSIAAFSILLLPSFIRTSTRC